MKLLAGPLQKAMTAAASLTGKRFSLLVASSLVATTGVVAVGAGGSGTSPIAAAAVRALMEEKGAAVASAPEAPELTSPSTSSPRPAPSGESAPSVPLSSPAPAPESTPAPAPEAPSAPSSEPEAPEPGPIQHVFWISLASPGYEAAFGASSQMPYLAGELRPQGLLLTNYTLLDPGALPNGIAAVSGQAPTAASKAGCPRYEDCLQDVETLSLADQLVGTRLRWHGYFEGMSDEAGKPDNCVHPEPEAGELTSAGGYSTRLNPFIYFHSLLDLGDCDENDVPLDDLAEDLKKPDATANLSYFSPSLCDAGFRGSCPEGTADGAAAADAFLARVVPEILASPAYKADGLLIVSFGAADPVPPSDPSIPPTDPKKVGGLLLSPLLAPGATDGTAYTPYSLLRSIEDLFALEPLGAAGGAKVRSFAPAFTAGNGGD